MKTLFLIVFLYCQCYYSQDVKTELFNISKAFLETKNIGVISTTKGFDENNNSKAIDQSIMEYYKNNKKSYRKYTNTEIIINDHYKININSQKKLLFISKAEPLKESKTHFSKSDFEHNFMVALDTTFKMYKKVLVNTISTDVNEIVFTFKEGMYKEVKVSYNSKTYMVNSYSLILNKDYNSETKKMKVVKYDILYTYIPAEKINAKLFDEKQYVIIKSEKISPTKKYSGYTILNNIKK